MDIKGTKHEQIKSGKWKKIIWKWQTFLGLSSKRKQVSPRCPYDNNLKWHEIHAYILHDRHAKCYGWRFYFDLAKYNEWYDKKE